MNSAASGMPAIEAGRRDTMAIATARGAIAVAVCGAGFSPPVCNLALFVALAALLLAPSARDRFHAVLRLPLAWAAFAFVALLAVGTLWSAAPWGERIHQISNWRPLVLMLIALCVFSNGQSKSRLAAVVVAFAVLAAVLSFGSWLIGRPTQLDQLPGMVLRNSSTQSMVMVVGLTLAAVLSFWRGPGAVSSRWQRWVFGAAAAFLAANLLVVTTGRSGQLALLIIVVTLLVSLLGGRIRIALLVLVPLLTAAVLATSPVVNQRFGQGWDEIKSVETAPELSSMGMRVVMWRTSVEVIRDRPWIGYGTGGFAAAYEQKTAQINKGWRATPTADPHNQYLFVWAELGIAGLLGLLGLIAVAARQKAARPWKQVSLALLLAWSATSVFSSHFQTFNEGHMLFLLLGTFLAPEPGAGGAASSASLRPMARSA